MCLRYRLLYNSPFVTGNTAISSNKKIVFQSLAKAAPKILTTSPTGSVSKATTNLSPQQQRIVLQNFKQPVMATNQSGTLTALGGNATRVIPAINTKPNSVQILGPRVVPQSQTVRPVQQKIGAVSIVANKPVTSISATETSNPVTISTSSPVTGGGTIVKMSPQAFASLQQQQQQLKQKVNSTSPALNSPQQRIIVGEYG